MGCVVVLCSVTGRVALTCWAQRIHGDFMQRDALVVILVFSVLRATVMSFVMNLVRIVVHVGDQVS